MKKWIIVGTALLLLVVVAFIEVYEEPPAEDAWLDVPAICYEGRLFYWDRVFDAIPNYNGEWELIGTTEGVSRKTDRQELYIHAAEIEHGHGKEDGAGCDTVEISDELVGEIWACPEFPDVLYVYLKEGYHSTPWVRFSVRGLSDLICWNGRLYITPGYHVSSGEGGRVEQLPEGFAEAGRIGLLSVDRVPTEDASSSGNWKGLITQARYQSDYFGSAVWEDPAEPETIYLRVYWNDKTYYIPAHLLTEETAGELTIPEQFLPLPE